MLNQKREGFYIEEEQETQTTLVDLGELFFSKEELEKLKKIKERENLRYFGEI
jgi:hypothetical protein